MYEKLTLKIIGFKAKIVKYKYYKRTKRQYCLLVRYQMADYCLSHQTLVVKLSAPWRDTAAA
jgi:hypothetical protein